MRANGAREAANGPLRVWAALDRDPVNLVLLRTSLCACHLWEGPACISC